MHDGVMCGVGSAVELFSAFAWGFQKGFAGVAVGMVFCAGVSVHGYR